MKKLVICMGSSCYSRGNAKNVEVAEKFLAEHGLKDDVDIDLSGSFCTGNCSDGPIVIVDDEVYRNVDPPVMLDILSGLFPGKE